MNSNYKNTLHKKDVKKSKSNGQFLSKGLERDDKNENEESKHNKWVKNRNVPNKKKPW